MFVALVALVMSTTGTTIAAATLLPRDSVGATQLRAGAVGSAEVRNRSITLPDLAYPTIASLRRPAGAASGALGGTYPSPTLVAGAVTAAALADGSVIASKLAEGSIGGSKIMSGSIGADDLIAEEDWHVIGAPSEVAYAATWGSTATGSYQQAGFRKDRFGIVHMRGVAFRGADGTASYMFTLPVGYRPSKIRSWPVASFGSAIGVLEVESDGRVWISTSANDNQVSLEGVSFVAGA
ncbi:MAG: hypothetical protein JWM86_1381 [Thermoleophilia bacterium]|nr:hypothetical protein [Thermoleophilia bacterium]